MPCNTPSAGKRPETLERLFRFARALRRRVVVAGQAGTFLLTAPGAGQEVESGASEDTGQGEAPGADSATSRVRKGVSP